MSSIYSASSIVVRLNASRNTGAVCPYIYAHTQSGSGQAV